MHNLTRVEQTNLSSQAANSASFSPEPERQWTDYVRMGLRRWYILPVSVVVLSLLAFFVSELQPKVYQSTAEVMVQSPASAASASVSSSQYAEIANILGVSGGSDLTTQIETMTSDAAMKQVAADNDYLPAPIPSDFKGHFDIEPFKTSTEIVTVTATAEKPKKAAQLIKSLIKVYNRTVGQQSSTAVGRLSQSTFQELTSVGNKLNRAEAERSAYSQSIGSVDITAESAQKVNQLYTLRAELLTAEQSLTAAKSLYQFYNSQMKSLEPTIVPNLTFASNPRIDDDKAQLEKLEQERVILSAQYTPSDDQMIQNQSQIDVIKRQMQTEREQESKNFAFSLGETTSHVTAPSGSYVVGGGTEVLNPLREDARAKLAEEQANVDSALSQEAVLNQALAALHDDVASTPEAIRKMNDLTANVEVLRAIYTDLQTQSAQLQARLPAEQSFATFLSGPIVPKKLYSPKPDLAAVLGAILGLLVGCIIAVLIDNGDIRVRDGKDAELIFGQPLLQSISMNRQLGPLLSSEEGIEPYKELAFTLGYLGIGKAIRSILVTSAVKDEGATTVASNLAVALSKEGQRVVLVDANVKRPTLHILFGHENNVGLAGLMRNGTQPDHALLAVSGSTSLRLIPGGETSELADGVEGVNAEKFQLILERLKEKADIVIVDAPGVFEGFETSLLADKVDGIVFVTRAGFGARATVRRAFDLLQRCNAEIIGTVVTDVKS